MPLPKPVAVTKGDTLTVTCPHDQALRDVLPAYRASSERYVAWGEGTTDEMCLGIVLLTRPCEGRGGSVAAGEGGQASVRSSTR